MLALLLPFALPLPCDHQEVRALQPSSLQVKKLMAYQMLAGLRDMHSGALHAGRMLCLPASRHACGDRRSHGREEGWAGGGLTGHVRGCASPPAGYIHGDVQAKNMLLRGNCTLRLADFGFSVPIKVRQ